MHTMIGRPIEHYTSHNVQHAHYDWEYICTINYLPTVYILFRKYSRVLTNITLPLLLFQKMPCPLALPCRLPNSHRTDNITLGSLEEIEINQFTGSDEQLEFLKLLVSRCSVTRIISVELNKGDFAPPSNKEIAQKICSICRPSFRV